MARPTQSDFFEEIPDRGRVAPTIARASRGALPYLPQVIWGSRPLAASSADLLGDALVDAEPYAADPRLVRNRLDADLALMRASKRLAVGNQFHPSP